MYRGWGGAQYGHCIRVLAIDGGGIRGIIPAMLLAEIEYQTDKPISEIFDLIVGTSTGGIIALGLSKPDPKNTDKPEYTAKHLVQFYKDNGKTIFSSRFSFFEILGPWFRPEYKTEGIESVLKKFFGDAPLNSSLTNVVVTAYELEPEQGHYFFQSNTYPYNNFFMRDVARAASAAPTYFPPVRLPVPPDVNTKGYVSLIDGGVFANNPALYALRFAPEARAAPPSNDILLVSLGTGAVSVKMPFEEVDNWGLLRWIKPLRNIVFSDPGVEHDLEYVLRDTEHYQNRYYRFQPILETISADMDNVSKDNIDKLEKAAINLITNKSNDLKSLSYQLTAKRDPSCPWKRTTKGIWSPREGEY